MSALFSLLLIVTLSFFIIRVATVALSLTGLSREVARFQATSAFTGVGFTTEEAETTVYHPVRRRIILLLMRLGSVGLVTAISSLLLTFIPTTNLRESFTRLILLAGGLALIWFISLSRWIDRQLSRLIEWALRHYTDLRIQDYESLLHVRGEYRVAEITVAEEAWLTHRTLAETKLRDEGVLVLGIERVDGTYIGAPTGETRICPGDSLALYGRSSAIRELGTRLTGKGGDQAHDTAVDIQKRVLEEQATTDKHSAYEKKS